MDLFTKITETLGLGSIDEFVQAEAEYFKEGVPHRIITSTVVVGWTTEEDGTKIPQIGTIIKDLDTGYVKEAGESQGEESYIGINLF